MKVDIIDFWKRQVEKWDSESKCGECWVFGAPLTEDAANKQQSEVEDACCVHVYITDLRRAEGRIFASNGLVKELQEVWNYNIHFLKRDNIGVNTFNEILDHPISESKWEMILKPILVCVTEENVLEYCEILGLNLDIIRWDMNTRINYLDENYTGWTANASFRFKY